MMMHLEGEANLVGQSMQMRIWTDGGSVLDPASGVAVKVEGGKTYVQQRVGEWREQEGGTDALAPNGDFMSYLAALRDPVPHAPETRNGVTFTRYTFRLDGPALAAYFRDRSEEMLRSRGKLPAGMRLETSAYYRDMVGSGELWIGADGLPLRQILNMRFPEQDGEIVQAEMVTNYSRFGPVAGVAPASSAWNVPGVLAALRSRLPVLAGTLGLAVVVVPGLLFLRRRGRLFQALSVALVILLVANPLMRQLQAADAAAALAETAATQEKQKADSRNAEALRESLAQTRWNPHADPLKETPLAAEKIASAGAAAGHLVQVTPEATPFPPVDPGTDTDGDGLTDFVEVRVGTNPNYSDTDEDAVPDVIEVKGFAFSGQHWYMDANATDTNNDGISDGVEYDFNQDANTPDDTDGDRIPDVFDDDNDGDGVPDAKDLSPFKTGAESLYLDQPLPADDPEPAGRDSYVCRLSGPSGQPRSPLVRPPGPRLAQRGRQGPVPRH